MSKVESIKLVEVVESCIVNGQLLVLGDYMEDAEGYIVKIDVDNEVVNLRDNDEGFSIPFADIS